MTNNKIMKTKIIKKKPIAKKAKKPATKAKKKLTRVVRAKRVVKKISRPKAKNSNKPIGTVTHFYNEISVAIIRFKEKVPQGTMLYFKGATTDFKHPAKSMQYDHKPIAIAPKGKQVGIKVPKRVREGDKVHRVQ
jgi:hypothetical protein